MAYLVGARNAKKRKREMRNSLLENVRKKKMKPVKETHNCPGIRRIADIDLIIKQRRKDVKIACLAQLCFQIVI